MGLTVWGVEPDTVEFGGWPVVLTYVYPCVYLVREN
jgi:hypothetical protein